MLTLVLAQVAPHACDISALAVDITTRCDKVVRDAQRIGVDAFTIEGDDLMATRSRLVLAFVAALVGAHMALEAVVGFDPAEIMRGESSDDREERAFRMWFTSLGVGMTINHLFEDCRTGLPLLHIEDHLQPGIAPRI